MKDISIDNKIYASKKEIDRIDDMIDENKKMLDNLDSIQYTVHSLKNNINKCAELVGKSVRGKGVDRLLADIKDKNISTNSKYISSIDDQKILYQKKISSLYDEKDKLISEMRKESNKLMQQSKNIENDKSKNENENINENENKNLNENE